MRKKAKNKRKSLKSEATEKVHEKSWAFHIKKMSYPQNHDKTAYFG